jgi:hypothetical protein
VTVNPSITSSLEPPRCSPLDSNPLLSLPDQVTHLLLSSQY